MLTNPFDIVISALEQTYNERFTGNSIVQLLLQKNRLMIDRLLSLAFYGDKEVKKSVVKLFYNMKCDDQLVFLYSTGDNAICSGISQIAMKEKEGFDVLSKIFKPALMQCISNIDISKPEFHRKICNILKAVKQAEKQEFDTLISNSYKEFETLSEFSHEARTFILNCFRSIFMMPDTPEKKEDMFEEELRKLDEALKNAKTLREKMQIKEQCPRELWELKEKKSDIKDKTAIQAKTIRERIELQKKKK